MKFTVIIPTFHEERNIGSVLKRMPKGYNVIVIDDGSRDNTAKVARSFGCRVIRTRHYGKGHACKAGLSHSKTDVNVFIDGDGQLDPTDIKKVAKRLAGCDMVLGQRNLRAMPFQRRAANRVARKLIKKITGQGFGDVLCGLRGIRKSRVEWKRIGNGYEFETDMLIDAAKKGLHIGTAPVSVSYRTGSRMPKLKSIRLFLRLFKKCF